MTVDGIERLEDMADQKRELSEHHEGTALEAYFEAKASGIDEAIVLLRSPHTGNDRQGGDS